MTIRLSQTGAQQLTHTGAHQLAHAAASWTLTRPRPGLARLAAPGRSRPRRAIAAPPIARRPRRRVVRPTGLASRDGGPGPFVAATPDQGVGSAAKMHPNGLPRLTQMSLAHLTFSAHNTRDDLARGLVREGLVREGLVREGLAREPRLGKPPLAAQSRRSQG